VNINEYQLAGQLLMLLYIQGLNGD